MAVLSSVSMLKKHKGKFVNAWKICPYCDDHTFQIIMS